MQNSIYGVFNGSGAAEQYVGPAASLPGAAAMSAGILARVADFDPANAISFGNLSGVPAGWRIRLVAVAAGENTTGNVIQAVIQTNARIHTVPIGATLMEWVFVSFAKSGTTVTVYVNGEAVYADTDAGNVVTPQAGAPVLTIPGFSKGVVSAAFYTEQALSADQMSLLGLFARDFPFVGATLDHLYSAPASLRPTAGSLPFADTGSVGGLPLTPPNNPNAMRTAVSPAYFGQAIVADTAGVVPGPVSA